MPVSKLSHPLAILRKNLALKQSELAAIVGCSTATIQSVELGRLELSVGLATRIAVATGTDREWLLRNDTSVPMPPRPFFLTGVASTGLQTYINTISLLVDVFSRLFAEVRKLEKTGARDELERVLAAEMEVLKKTVKDPNAQPLQSTTKDVYQYFDEYLELPDSLNQLLDLDYLIATTPERLAQKAQPPGKVPGRSRPLASAARRRKSGP